MNDKPKPTLAEIKARLRAVCICKGIKMGKILDAINSGCTTVEEVNKKTGSGGGGCGATRCRPVIEALLQNGGKPEEALAARPEENDDY